MIDEADRDAIVIMARASEHLVTDFNVGEFERFQAIKVLHHAIRHLAYPDRDIYPKVRHAKKLDPVTIRRQP